VSAIHVLTSCTGLKDSGAGTERLERRHFARGADAVADWHRSHPGLLRPAEQLYRGQHHLRLMRGVRHARSAGLDIRVSIVSAGYGVVDGHEPIAPYEATFQGMSTSERRAWSQSLGIPATVERILGATDTRTIVLLGDDYLDACALTGSICVGSPTLVFCAPGTALRLPALEDLHPIILRTEHTRRFRCGLVGLKGEVGGRLLSLLAERPETRLDVDSERLLDLLCSYLPARTDSSQPVATLI
jgi:hypothetical protein